MKEILKPGQLIYQRGAEFIKVDRFLGSGGQGEVYRVRTGAQEGALKWYYPSHASQTQKKLIEQLCRIGPPNGNFLWPERLVEDRSIKGFGYMMPLRPPHYRSIVDMMKRRVDPSFRVVTLAALRMVDSYKRLHDKGLCYRDISFGNVFFDAGTGEVLICDNDNIAHESVADNGVLGTPRFMAPELVTGRCAPTVASDLYSLSVLLFYLFFVHHPLEGKREAEIKCFDLPAMTKLYGTDPVFIFDPDNASNRPVRKLHDNALIYWNIYPRYFKDLFTQAFTTGLRKPEARLPEAEWLRGLETLLQSIHPCGCGAENFYDLSRVRGGEPTGSCWSCNRPLTLPLRMRLGDSVVVLSPETCIYPHQVMETPRRDYERLYGQVVRHPATPDRLGLRNLSQDSWRASSVSGRTVTVAPGQTLALEDGQTVAFGSILAEIKL